MSLHWHAWKEIPPSLRPKLGDANLEKLILRWFPPRLQHSGLYRRAPTSLAVSRRNSESLSQSQPDRSRKLWSDLQRGVDHEPTRSLTWRIVGTVGEAKIVEGSRNLRVVTAQGSKDVDHRPML